VIFPRGADVSGDFRRTFTRMAGRHRKPPAWRTFLRSLVRSRNHVRTAALRAEIAQLRATVARLEAELTAVREVRPAPASLSLEAPLVRLALSGVEVDRGPDTAYTEIVLPDRATPEPSAEPVAAARAPEPALPERELLDPKADRDTDALIATAVAPAPAKAPEMRRSA
jgi:hypothetical protein